MPTVETEANGDSRRKGPSLIGSLGSSCGLQKIYYLPWLHALVGSNQTNFFLILFHFVYPHNPCSKLDRQSCRIMRLLKVHKIEIFFGFDFEICNISLIIRSKY
jgi:hypothetical protein